MTFWRPPLLFLLLAACLAAHRPAHGATSEWASNPHGAARLITAVEATGSSRQLDAALQLRLTPGWHTYWRTPGDAGVSPTIDWSGSENLAGVAISWPAPHRLPPLAGLETQGYEDGVVLPISVTLVHPGQALRLHAEVDYASCKDVCIPYHASLTLMLPPGLAAPGQEASLIATARARVPSEMRSAGLNPTVTAVADAPGGAVLSLRLASIGAPLRAPDLFIEGLPRGSPGRPRIELADAGRTATLRAPITGAHATEIAGTHLRLTLVDGDRSAETEATPSLGTLPSFAGDGRLFAVLGIALLGGLLLNLMPCVLPVLSLKLLAVIRRAREERRIARLSLLSTAAGLVVSFAALASILIALKAAGASIGWGIQFQQPWFLAAMALLTTLFAASLWGWMPITLPSRIAAAAGSIRSRRQLANAFLMGAFATLLAASCSAPFVGTALGFALARGPLDILLVLAALGTGMAVPFLVIAAWPGLVAWLPRPGRWMTWLERALGVGLLGTAAWLLTVLAAETGLRPALTAAGALLLLLAALRTRRAARPGAGARWAMGAAVIGFGTVAVLAPALLGTAVSADAANPSGQIHHWRTYDAATVQELVNQGQIVFLDVSAAWCLTCKVNELAVLDRSPVADRLREPGVLAMRADWTHPDPKVTALLQSFGRFGVPMDVVYGPGAVNGIALPELLTTAAVMNALDRARGVSQP